MLEANVRKFDWDTTGHVASQVQQVLSDRLVDLPVHAAATVAALCRVSADCRLASVYLNAVEFGDEPVAEMCLRIAADPDDTRLRHELNRLRFALPTEVPGQLRESVAELLSDRAGHMSAYVADPELRRVFVQLLDDLGAGLPEYLENQHEVPGPNARIRQGVVRTWFLPDGTKVVSKRENPLKPGRFAREVNAQRRIVDRLGLDGGRPVPLEVARNGRLREVAVPQQMALLRAGGTGSIYTVSRWVAGSSLESLLLRTSPGDQERAARLHDYRDILDFLFDHGIVWGDISPRNVLIERQRDRDVFHLVDFEKTSFRDAPISHPERVLHCRGQIVVEELGVLCPPDEMGEVLAGYFDPTEWDLDSTGPVPFPLRPEIADVLQGRGVTHPSLGLYNRTDLEILDVRSPDVEPLTGARRFPGFVNFRVEHYLSCARRGEASDYDRKTTEVLIGARRYSCFEQVLSLVADAADEVERQFVVNEVTDLLDGRTTGIVTTPEEAIGRLTARLDALYSALPDPIRFEATWAAMIGEVKA